jgi:hypothetical protein
MCTQDMRGLLKLSLVIILVFSVFVLYTSQTIEPFGMLGCSKIPFNKFIVDIHTPSEYQEWKKTAWGKLTSKDKNDFINWWDSLPCEKHNSSYNDGVKSRKQREAIENS